MNAFERPSFVFLAVLAALAGRASFAAAQDVPAPDRFAPARELAARLVAERAAPAIAIAVLDGDAVVWAEGFGLADAGGARPATADTMFRLASISKPFTATALMCLVDDGALALDDPANRHLGDARLVAHRGEAAAMTLRRLANHTAGMPTHWNFFYAGSAPPPRDVTIARYGFAAWVPGTTTNYSNLAFGVLDHVIARRSGGTFAAFVEQRVLRPLGMAHTSVGAPARPEQAAVGCRRAPGGGFLPVVDYGFDHDGASAVWSSARDLMRFARLFGNGGEVDGVRVLSAASVRTMTEARGEVPGNRYGVGWRTDRDRGTLRLSHTGGMPGVSTALEVFPERRAAVAVLTNAGERSATQRCLAAILPILVPEAGQQGDVRAAAAGAPAASAPAARAPGPAPATVPPAALPSGLFRGRLYTITGPLDVELRRSESGEAVALTLGGDSVAVRAQLRDGKLVLTGRALLPTTDAFHGTPELEIELRADGAGLAGVAYAIGDATFRLPHWIELGRVDDAK